MPEVFVSSALRELHKKNNATGVKLSFCHLRWDSLNVRHIDISHAPSISEIEGANEKFVSPGGRWQPSQCFPFQRVAIIVPYRNRWFHLRILLHRLHPMLRLQKLDYQIFVIEQSDDTPFNRGMLMNVGVNEALKFGHFDCFIFHDVDLIPEHDRNVYLCDDDTRHLASAIDEMRYHVLFYNYAGGVVALTRENVFKINGYPNLYWGWGNEDDDFSARTLTLGLKISRPPEHIGRYKMIRHKKESRSDNGYELFLTWRHRHHEDGLNSLSPTSYNLQAVKNESLYTNVSVVLHMPSPEVLKRRTDGPRESLYWFLRFYGWLL